MFWKRSRRGSEGEGAAGAVPAESRATKWRQRAIVAALCALLAVLAARRAWRAVVYDPADRRVEEWCTADPARRTAIEKELAGLRWSCHIRRLIWHTGDDADIYASAVSKMAWETLKGMGERVIEPARRQVTAWKPLAHGESVFIDRALRFLPGYLDDVARLRLGQYRQRTSMVDQYSMHLLMGAGPSAKPVLRRLADSKQRRTRSALLQGLNVVRSTSVHEFRLELAERWGNDAQPSFAQVLGVFVWQTGLRLPPLDDAAFDRCEKALDATQAGMSMFAPAAPRAAWPSNNALVLKALGAVDNPEAAEVIARFLADGGTPRFDAAVMLALHDDPRALLVLMEEFGQVKTMSDRAFWGSQGQDCLESLARVADAEAVAEMAKAAEQQNTAVGYAAVTSLRQVTQQDLRPAEIRRQAREALDRLGTNEDSRQRAVVQVLTKAQPQGDLYETALERASGVYTLGDYAGDDVTDALVAALSDPHPWVRRAAARSLGRIAKRGSIAEAAKPKVREGLKKAAGDSDASVREATVEAIEALRKQGGTR